MRRCGGLLLILVLCGLAPTTGDAAPPGVKVKERKQGDTIYLEVTNPNLCELTFSMDLKLQNLTANPPGQIRLVCSPQSTRTAAILRVTEPGKSWRYSYKTHWQWGSS